MAATTTLIDAKRVLGDGASYRVRARIDQQALARLVGEMTARAAEQGSLTLAEEAIVITAERTGQLLRKPRAKIISCHLGGSSSICAIREGKSVTYDMKADRSDPTAVGTREMGEAIVAALKS